MKKIRLYDKNAIDKNNLLFDNKMLFSLLLPVIIEQILNSFMGMADTMMVSNIGGTAVSAVSLVDSVNMLVIQVFSALATGAAIVCSQYLGSGDNEGCNKAARQVVFSVTVISVVIMIAGLITRVPLLRLVFGSVEPQVMQLCQTYFIMSAVSYPFLALFNAGSAFFRASGNSRLPMLVALVSNVFNVAGNAVFIYVFNLGVFGAALSTLLSRMFSMAMIFIYLRMPRQVIVIKNYFNIRPDFVLVKKILAIGIPAGVENGMFQFGKLAIQSCVSSMGTIAIAAQAMTNILENVNGVFAQGVGIGMMTVVGQCIGAGRKEEARYNIVKLTKVAIIGLFFSCLFAYAIARPVTVLGGMEEESAKMCISMVTAITIVKPLTWGFSFIPAYGMRAAGDVKFSMCVSMCTMWCLRVALCIFLVEVFSMGPMAVWYGMFADWTVRGIIFVCRFLSGKWIKSSVAGE